MRDFIVTVGFILGTLVGAMVLTALIVLAFMPIAKQQCINTAEIYGTDYQWRMFGGCFLKTERGRYVPLEHYRYAELDILE
jgi:hypothetical protein